MSITSSVENHIVGFAPDPFRRRRNRLRRSMLVAFLILILSGAIGAIGWHRRRSTPPPDYYKTLLTDLAEQHYRLTGTPTLIRENERTLDYLNRLYNQAARRDRRPEERVSVSYENEIQSSFVPGALGWINYPLAYLAEKPMAPSMTFTEPSGAPLALWVFSRSEQALAILFAEQPVIDDLVNPGLRIIETISSSGAVAVAGDFKSGGVVFCHAYLLPLGQLGLDESGAWAGNIAALEQVVGAIPLLFGVGATSSTGQTRLDASQSQARLLAASPPVFFTAARLMQWVIFPAALVWVAWTLLRLRKVRSEWNRSLSWALQEDPPIPRFGFFCFLTVDLIAEAERLLAESIDQRCEEASRRQEQLRRERFETEIRYCLKTLASLRQESPCDEEWLTAASTAEMDEMAARCRWLVEQRQDQIDKQQQAARERARQIQRLESEFAAIPLEKRAEATSAWALYEQACAASDPGKRLDMLKSARKLLPKEFRNDQIY
ncbi:MAG: hypothetical protein MOB07_04805 [Acidobacteria bacterium]|nr:hypothetical protein [Acidobacteriota bacterium]